MKVNIPDKGETTFALVSEYEELPLGTLMNFLMFDNIHSNVINANFISKYSKELKRYQYFIERLGGVEMENEENPYGGCQWVVYLNERKHEWDLVCENETAVKPNDSIRFNYEIVTK